MISRGCRSPKLTGMLGAGDERPPVKDPLRSLAMRAVPVLCWFRWALG